MSLNYEKFNWILVFHRENVEKWYCFEKSAIKLKCQERVFLTCISSVICCGVNILMTKC